MNDPTVIAAAFVTVIAAIVGGVVTVFNAIAAANDRKDARLVRQRLDETTKNTEHKADTIIGKATEIHTLTNSNLSRVTAALEVANTKIEGLQRMMESLAASKLIADRTAEALANKVLPPRRAGDTFARAGEGAIPGPQPVIVVNAADAPVPTEVVNQPSAPVPTEVVEPASAPVPTLETAPEKPKE